MPLSAIQYTHTHTCTRDKHILKMNTAILSTGWVLLYLPHHLDLASEYSVGHSTCMSVLARRRAIMGSIVQTKRSCLGLSKCCHVLVTVHAGHSTCRRVAGLSVGDSAVPHRP